jgi:hypothetical protein
VLAVCLTAISLFGQITGDLQVRVADATDAVVPNAVVTVRSLDTNATRTVKTDATGDRGVRPRGLDGLVD